MKNMCLQIRKNNKQNKNRKLLKMFQWVKYQGSWSAIKSIRIYGWRMNFGNMIRICRRLSSRDFWRKLKIKLLSGLWGNFYKILINGLWILQEKVHKKYLRQNRFSRSQQRWQRVIITLVTELSILKIR